MNSKSPMNCAVAIGNQSEEKKGKVNFGNFFSRVTGSHQCWPQYGHVSRYPFVKRNLHMAQESGHQIENVNRFRLRNEEKKTLLVA